MSYESKSQDAEAAEAKVLARHKAIRQRDVDKANAAADVAKAAKVAAVMLVKSSEAREKVIRRRAASEAAAKAKAAAEAEAEAKALAAKEAAQALVEWPLMEAEDHDVPLEQVQSATNTGAMSCSLPQGYMYDDESDAAGARRAFRAVVGPPRGERGGGGGLEAEWEHIAALLAAAGIPLAEDDAQHATTPSPLALLRAQEVIGVEFPNPAQRPALCSMSELSHLLPIAHLASHFFRLDEDGNGSLSVSELVSAANAILGGDSNNNNTNSSTLAKKKSKRDSSSYGRSSTNDYDDDIDSEPVGTQELLGALSEALCANLLAQMDSDSDGRVDLAEFVHFFRWVLISPQSFLFFRFPCTAYFIFLPGCNA